MMLRNLQERGMRLLRWSERYTKTDMVYLARGGSLSIFGQAVGIVASLALAVAVSHLVPKEVYGTYKFVLSAVAMLSLFSLNSIGTAVFRSAAHGLDGALHKGFWENIRWSIAVFAGAFALAGYYFIVGNTTLAIGILIGGSLSPFLASANLFGSFLGGKKDFFRQTMYGIIDNIVPIGIFIGVILLTSNTLILIATYFLTNTLAALYFYRRTMLVYHANMHLHDEEMLAYSKHLSVMGIMSGIASGLDQILLFHYVGAAQLAVYSFATAIPDQIKGPAKTLDAMLQARFAGRSDHDIHLGMRHKLFSLFLTLLACTLAYIALAPPIFKVLFPNYTDAVLYSQIYSVSMLVLTFIPASSYLAIKKKVQEQYIANIAYSVFQIASILIGVVFWGLMGLVVARVLSATFTRTLYYVLYRRAVRVEMAGKSRK